MFAAPATAHATSQAMPKESIFLSAPDYPSYISKCIVGYGVWSQTVTESLEHVNIQPEFEFVPINRAIAAVMGQTSRYDGSFGWAHSGECDRALLYPSRPSSMTRIMFFYRKGSAIGWQNLIDLARYRIGAERGNYYSDEFARLGENRQLSIEYAVSDFGNCKEEVLKVVNSMAVSLLGLDRCSGLS